MTWCTTSLFASAWLMPEKLLIGSDWCCPGISLFRHRLPKYNKPRASPGQPRTPTQQRWPLDVDWKCAASPNVHRTCVCVCAASNKPPDMKTTGEPFGCKIATLTCNGRTRMVMVQQAPGVIQNSRRSETTLMLCSFRILHTYPQLPNPRYVRTNSYCLWPAAEHEHSQTKRQTQKHRANTNADMAAHLLE